MATSRNQQWITIREIPGYSKEVIERLRGFGFGISKSYSKKYFLDGKYFDSFRGFLPLETKKISYLENDLYPLEKVEKHREYEFKVRSADVKDAKDAAEALNHPNVLRTFPAIFYKGEMSEETERKFIEELLEDRFSHLLVCEDIKLNKAMGFLSLLQQRNSLSRHVGIIGIFINANYQGLGVETKLMKEAEILAKRLRLKKLELTTFESNKVARHLYEQIGYKYCGALPGVFNGKYSKFLYMEKELK
jgi:ribosomal protein S18 acetylase RimI-like enzyme